MIRIRRAEKNDIPALVELWKEMWLYHRQVDPRYELTDIAVVAMNYWLDEHIKNNHSLVLIAENDTSKVGYLLAIIVENPLMIPEQFSGYISEIAVTTTDRRKGIGNRLVCEAHTWFKKNSIRYVDVNASVFNKVSGNFWRKHGYKEFLERLRIEL